MIDCDCVLFSRSLDSISEMTSGGSAYAADPKGSKIRSTGANQAVLS